MSFIVSVVAFTLRAFIHTPWCSQVQQSRMGTFGHQYNCRPCITILLLLLEQIPVWTLLAWFHHHHNYSESQIPPDFFWYFFFKRLVIFSPNCTCLFYVPIYAGLQIFIQLPANLTKLGLRHIKRNHHYMLKMFTLGWNACWVRFNREWTFLVDSLVMTPTPCRVAGCIISIRPMYSCACALTYLLT